MHNLLFLKELNSPKVCQQSIFLLSEFMLLLTSRALILGLRFADTFVLFLDKSGTDFEAAFCG
jgi:hypothetical protein